MSETMTGRCTCNETGGGQCTATFHKPVCYRHVTKSVPFMIKAVMDRFYKPSRHGIYPCICGGEFEDYCRAPYHLNNPKTRFVAMSRAERQEAESLMRRNKAPYGTRP